MYSNEVEETNDKVAALVEKAVLEMKTTVGLIGGEDKFRIVMWRFVNEHTKLLREFYKVGQ